MLNIMKDKYSVPRQQANIQEVNKNAQGEVK